MDVKQHFRKKKMKAFNKLCALRVFNRHVYVLWFIQSLFIHYLFNLAPTTYGQQWHADRRNERRKVCQYIGTDSERISSTRSVDTQFPSMNRPPLRAECPFSQYRTGQSTGVKMTRGQSDVLCSSDKHPLTLAHFPPVLGSVVIQKAVSPWKQL